MIYHTLTLIKDHGIDSPSVAPGEILFPVTRAVWCLHLSISFSRSTSNRTLPPNHRFGISPKPSFFYSLETYCFPPVIGKIMAPQDVHVLIPETSECATQSEIFVDVIKGLSENQGS